MNPEVRAARQAIIDRAVRLLDHSHPDDLAHWLAQTGLYDHLKANPALLRANLVGESKVEHDVRNPGIDPSFAAWKAAQQILQAAGLPYR